MTCLLVEHHGPIAVLTLNRPQAMNALSADLRQEFGLAIARLDSDPSVSVCVLTGAGDRAFCAGLDLKEIRTDPRVLRLATGDDPAGNPAVALGLMRKPIIAAVNGVAITGGFELALACDIIFASEGARFADTHARVGLLPAWGLSQRLARLIGPFRAKELTFSGRFLSARDAYAWGLANRVVAPTVLMSEALSLAGEIAGTSVEALKAHKKLIDEGYRVSLRDGLALERQNARDYNSAFH